jgi:hypothetical protein
MVVEDVSKPATKKTKAWAAREFIDRPVEWYILVQSRNLLINQAAKRHYWNIKLSIVTHMEEGK